MVAWNKKLHFRLARGTRQTRPLGRAVLVDVPAAVAYCSARGWGCCGLWCDGRGRSALVRILQMGPGARSGPPQPTIGGFVRETGLGDRFAYITSPGLRQHRGDGGGEMAAPVVACLRFGCSLGLAGSAALISPYLCDAKGTGTYPGRPRNQASRRPEPQGLDGPSPRPWRRCLRPGQAACLQRRQQPGSADRKCPDKPVADPWR
jgi:hypothetical protein